MSQFPRSAWENERTNQNPLTVGKYPREFVMVLK